MHANHRTFVIKNRSTSFDILKTSITNERERYSNYVDENKTKEFKYFFHLIFM